MFLGEAEGSLETKEITELGHGIKRMAHSILGFGCEQWVLDWGQITQKFSQNNDGKLLNTSGRSPASSCLSKGGASGWGRRAFSLLLGDASASQGCRE